MVQFNELQKDALCEIFNISVSQAAAALSEIVQERVRMTIPAVEICDAAKAIVYLDQGYDICGISQRFHSDFEGRAVLVFPEHRSLELVRLMVGVEVPLDTLTEMEQDALAEIGNIVLNACLASLSDMFHQQFDCDIPQLVVGSSDSVLSGYTDDNILILLKIKFILDQQELEGHIIFVVNAQSLEALEHSINQFLQAVGGAY